jgi:hypothetical protein
MPESWWDKLRSRASRWAPGANVVEDPDLPTAAELGPQYPSAHDAPEAPARDQGESDKRQGDNLHDALGLLDP